VLFAPPVLTDITSFFTQKIFFSKNFENCCQPIFKIELGSARLGSSEIDSARFGSTRLENPERTNLGGCVSFKGKEMLLRWAQTAIDEYWDRESRGEGGAARKGFLVIRSRVYEWDCSKNKLDSTSRARRRRSRRFTINN
jgi:hypothetical protein